MTAREHPTVARFPVRDGELVVGGIGIRRLAQRAGRTPFFAYDRRLVTERVCELRDQLPSGVHLSYALKANPMPALVGHLAGLVDGLDVASGPELRVALDTTVDATRITFAGPGKSDAELRQALAAGVLVEVESETEAERLVTAAEALDLPPRVAVRVNPDFEVKGSGMRMGGGPQQFGVDAERVPALLKQLAADGVEVEGFHVFPGSQNLHAGILAEAQRRTVELAVELAADLPYPVRYLNLGGGFGVPYFAQDRPLDLGVVAAGLHDLLSGVLHEQLPEAQVVIELGRYLVAEAGVYVTRVVDRKESRGETFLVVDGGMHHQLAASGNLGQVLRRDYPVLVADRMGEAPTEHASVVGCLCTPLDVLARRAELPLARPGDLIAVFLAGAYGRTASPSAFLSHPEPAEMLV